MNVLDHPQRLLYYAIMITKVRADPVCRSETVAIFSERSLFAVARPSVVCLSSVCLSSVTFVRPTQAVQIFRDISVALGTLAIR